MNWKLIFGLSLFGVAMGFGTLFAISARVEPLLWLPIFVICAFVIARQVRAHVFWHGFLLGIVNSVWVTGAHLIFFHRYLVGHPQEAAMMISAQVAVPPKLLMATVGPAIGIISGVVIGVLAYLVARTLKSEERLVTTKPRRARARS
jgi:hypothetical protein